ncbi:MAG: class I SAM-dependent methyltransferase [Gemmatimonadaceae bacterium]|nr:class I SAM-dependent methyltransferase [Gemmatimonadaceae bacterium]
MSAIFPPDKQPRAVRTGDSVRIAGDYQFRARTRGFVVQRFWHAEKERMIRKYNMPAAGESVLDVGCGSGIVSDFLASNGANVLAIDGNPAAIEFARKQFGRKALRFEVALVEEVAAAPESIDRTYCFELIEHIHLHQSRELLRLIYGLTKPGGTIAITTPNFTGVWPAIEKTLDSLRLVPKLDGEQHVTHFSAALLRELLTESGWAIERVSTFCTLSPWASLLGWRFAERLADREDEWNLPFGSLLFAVARKPGDRRE